MELLAHSGPRARSFDAVAANLQFERRRSVFTPDTGGLRGGSRSKIDWRPEYAAAAPGKTRAPAPFAIEPFRLRLQVQIELLAGPRTVRIAEASSLGAKRCGNPCRPDIDGPGDAAGDGPDTHLRQELGQPCERNPLQAQMQGFPGTIRRIMMPPCSARSSARPEAKAVSNWKSIFNGLGSTAADATPPRQSTRPSVTRKRAHAIRARPNSRAPIFIRAMVNSAR